MTRLLTGADGLLRLTDGNYIALPDTTVTAPTITTSGQARQEGGRYLQAGVVPTPLDGWSWWIYREGAPPVRLPFDGPQDIDVGPVSAPAGATMAFMAHDLDGRVSTWQRVVANIPNPQPLGIGGTIAITSAPFVGGPLTLTFPVVTFGTPPSPPTPLVLVYAEPGDAEPEDVIEPPFPATYQAEWVDKEISAYWAVVDPASSPTLREFETPRQTVISATTAAPTLADFNILRSVVRDGGHSPIFTVTNSARASWQIRWRAGPTTDTDAPHFGIEANGGSATERRLSDGFDPAFPTVNSAIFFSGPPRPARNDRLRFSWRPDASAPWSADSPLFSVPDPVVIVDPGDPGDPPPIGALVPDVTVNSVSALVAEVYRTSPLRRVIAVAPGTYASAVNLSTRIVRTPEDTVFIVPADYNNPPVFTRPWSIASRSSGVHINGLHFFSDEGRTGPASYQASNGNTCQIASGSWPTRTCISSSNVNRVAITNCRFDFWDIVVTMGSSTGPAPDIESLRPSGFSLSNIHGQETISRNIRFEYNTVTRTGMDCLRLYNNVNFIVRGNRSTNPRVDTARASCDSTRHCDWLQLACGRLGVGSYDFIIEDNYVEGINGYYQLILLLNERMVRGAPNGYGNDWPNGLGDPSIYSHRNGIIRGNEMSGGHVAGVYIAGCHNVLVETNVLRPAPGVTANGRKPALCLIGRNSGTVRDNVHDRTETGGFFVDRSTFGGVSGPIGRVSDVTQSGNIRTATGFPAGWAARHPSGLFNKTGQYGYNGGTPTAVIP